MIFVYKNWEKFCGELQEKGILSDTACDVAQGKAAQPYLVLKHDVETDVPRACEMAKIEHRYGHRGSYYVQAYLMQDAANVQLLQQMQAMGHEISYHYDVMDSCKGDLTKARQEFAANLELFEKNGFHVVTVCQHGNPVVERVGYTSNRDFFRSVQVQSDYPGMSDIMVNFKAQAGTDYIYYSDAGRRFQMIFDPINNDIVNSDDQNIYYDDLNVLMKEASIGIENSIISTHPHRWTSSETAYCMKNFTFKVIKKTAKLLMKMPIFKKVMSKYYYLAKKI